MVTSWPEGLLAGGAAAVRVGLLCLGMARSNTSGPRGWGTHCGVRGLRGNPGVPRIGAVRRDREPICRAHHTGESMAGDPQSEPPHFGDLLRRHRIAANLTQEALAERAGLSARGISDLERGARSHPYRETLTMLVSALALSGAERAAFVQAATRPGRPSRPGAALPTAWSSSISRPCATQTGFRTGSPRRSGWKGRSRRRSWMRCAARSKDVACCCSWTISSICWPPRR